LIVKGAHVICSPWLINAHTTWSSLCNLSITTLLVLCQCKSTLNCHKHEHLDLTWEFVEFAMYIRDAKSCIQHQTA
jgi:hypothetical protein